MIKRIACLATLLNDVEGSHYSELVFGAFESSRIYNKANNINGAFLVRDNSILQILEGEANNLANTMYRINRDSKISMNSIILNHEITSPIFTRWNIKLLNDGSITHHNYIKKLLEMILPDVAIRSSADQNQFNYIFEIGANNTLQTQPAISTNNRSLKKLNTHRFSNTTLFMKSWPSPTKLRLNAPLMKISSVLIGHNVDYQRLVDLQLFSSEQELQDTLALLEQAEALLITEKTTPENVAFINKIDTTTKPDKSSRRFSQALKKFIGSQRARGL